MEKHVEWWRDGVVYQVYPRSFRDTNGDGIGDIRGVIEKLDYLQWLGVDAIWLSPINSSPMDDFGYDVKDYRGIAEVFGSLADVDELLQEAHSRKIKVILDLVLNHTSDLHPWFLDARSSKNSARRDWYIWRDAVPGRHYPNNWRAAFGGRAWEWDEYTRQFYLHSFLKEQPDLDWRNPEVQAAVMDELRFWLERGVDGFRLDVVNWYVKDALLRDNPYHLGYSPRVYDMQRHIYDRNRPETHGIVRKMRRVLDGYDERMMVGEVFAPPPGDQQLAASYLGKGDDELHLSFDFSMMYTRWNAREFATRLETWMKLIPQQGWPCHVFSNHDQRRSFGRYGWRENTRRERARVLAVLLLTLRGTPFIYYGEEIGMRNGFVMRHEMADPLGHKYWPFYRGRDAQRTPMQWTAGYHAGFSRGHPWLPVNRDYRRVNVEAQKHDPRSLLNLYRELISLRRKHAALRQGDWQLLERGEHGVLGFRRSFGNESLMVLLNFCGSKRVPGAALNGIRGEVILSTKEHGGAWQPGKTLDGNEAVIICENYTCRSV